MIGFDEALGLVCEVARPLGVEQVALTAAAGRVLGADLKARLNAPAHDVSAMDGYGVHEDDVSKTPAKLPVTIESFAGSAPDQTLPRGECARIFTGAPVPEGVDRVIIQENVRRDDDVAIFNQAPGPGNNIRKLGSDFKAGDTLLAKGTHLSWKAMTTAAAADHRDLTVYRKPNAVVLATGDELKPPGSAYKTPGAIPESVSLGVSAFLAGNGVDVLRSERLADQLDTLEQAAARAVSDADLIVVTGGASVGEKDYAKTMFEPHGLELIFSKVAIKPGKPIWMARAGTSLIVGLPGNPTSALVTARLFLKPLIYGLTGLSPHAATAFRSVICRDPLPEIGGRETFSRAYIQDGEAALFSSQDSSSQATLAKASLLIRRKANAAALPAGQLVDVLDF